MGLWLLWLWVPLGLAEEETLLDTRLETSDLHWTVHPQGEGQWEELSALDAELGGAVRTFEVCSGRGGGGAGRDPAQNGWSPAQNSWSPAQNSWSPAQNSWLRSRWVPRGAATTVLAEIRFTVMACDSLGGTRGARGTRGTRDSPGGTRGTRGTRDSPGGTRGIRGTRDSDSLGGTRRTRETRDSPGGTRGTRDRAPEVAPDTPGHGPAPEHPPGNLGLHGDGLGSHLDLHGNGPEPREFRGNGPEPPDIHGKDPKLPGFRGNDPEISDFHGGDPKPLDFYGNYPKPLDFYGNYPKPLDFYGNYPKPLDLHQKYLETLDFRRNYPKPLDFHKNDPEPLDLHGNHSEPLDLHENDPELLDFHENDPEPLDLHGNHSEPLDLHPAQPGPGPPRPHRRRRRSPARPPRPCKETFGVFYHEADADTATATSPPWMENPYVKVDTVAAEHLARPGGQPGGNRVNRKVLRLGPLRRAGFYLAFQDLGACMALLSVRLFYRRCPAVTARLARFPATVPAELVAAVPGACVPGAVPAGEGVPLMYCREDGRWAEPPALGCVCGPGMEPSEGMGCQPCPPEMFKAEAGGGRCQPCPPQSEAPSPGAPSCPCRPGFFRAPGEGPSDRCSAPPSAPRALVAQVNGSVVRLSWSPPRAGGDRPDLRYQVGCRACPPPRGAPPPCGPCGPLAWAPPPQGLRTPAVSVAGLRPRVTYSFRVSARSGVTPPGPPEPPAAEINVTAGADVPPPVSDVVRVGEGPGGVTLAWPSPPPAPPGTPVLDYEVKFYEKLGGGEGPPQFLKVPRPRAELGGLRRGGLYGVRVRARSEGGYGEFGPETTVSAPGSEGSRGGPGGVVAGAAALGGLLVLALLGGTLVCLRRLRAEKQRRGPAPGGLGGKLYIDPLTYEDPEVALRDFAQEIDITCVTIEEVIGAGEFGEVWRGRLSLPGQPEAEVAVKTLKGGAGERQRREFLREAARMGQFRHPNVVRLRGVVSAGPPAMIVTEFLLHGALDAFLRGREGTLSPLQLVAMLRGIAAGMRYLAEAGFVHRDLAARNILVDAHLVCKVSDFGLSRALDGDRDSDPTYTSSLGGKIPIRWTAPEAIAFRTFTSASDAWSYGIVMWEVLSFGERPYWDMSNQDVINAIEQDYRLPPPPRCPLPLHRLMLQCWQRERGARPTFPHIVRALDRLIRRPESLRVPPPDPHSSSPAYLEQRSPPGPLPTPGPTPPAGQGLRGPGGAEEPLVTGVTGLELLPRLHSEDLLRMGVTLAGHQQRILEGAQSLRSPPKGDPQC